MRRLSRWSGALTRGQLDKAVIRQLFIFQLVSNFIVFSLLGVVYETYLTISEDLGKESWSTIYASLGDVPAKVTRAYISESLYWLSWYPSVIVLITRNIILMRNLRIRSVVACLQLLQIPRLILKTPQLLMIKTPHDLAEVVQPENFEVSAEICVSYTNLLLLLSTRSSIHTWWVHCIMHGALLIPIELALCYGRRVSKAVIGCYVLADHFLVWCTPRWLQSLSYARLFTFGHYISLWVWS